MKFTKTVTTDYDARYMHVEICPRYWDWDEDFRFLGPTGEEIPVDEYPLKSGRTWRLIIDLHTGQIRMWPKGVTCKAFSKVCDDGRYELLDKDGKVITYKEGYVPDMIGSYGDYLDIYVDGDGFIRDFEANLRYFEEDEDQ
jgi:hypothetical protein